MSLLDSVLDYLRWLPSAQNALLPVIDREGFTESIGFEQMSLKEIKNLDEQRRGREDILEGIVLAKAQK